MSPASFSTWESSTGSGLMQPIKKAATVIALATVNLVATGTTSGMPLLRPSLATCVTTSGLPFSTALPSASRRRSSPLLELRRRTGLTWDEVASLFRVSRRSVFLWASGKSMSSDNELLLARLLAFIQSTDRGSARANRQLLLGSTPSGHVVFDLLAAGRIDEARETLGTGPARPRPAPKPLSAAERRRREPPKPHELLGALQDPAPTDRARVRSVQKARSLKRS